MNGPGLTNAQSVEENVSIIVSCIPTLGPIIRSIKGKLKSLKSTNYPIPNGHLPRSDPHEGNSIPLHTIPNPLGKMNQYSAAAAGSTYKGDQGIYGSQLSLVPGIQRTTRVEVQRSDV